MKELPPKPKTPLENFLESADYKSVEKEINESVAEVTKDITQSQDIAPALQFLKEKAARYLLSEFETERTFWGIVGENLKKTRFIHLATQIRALMIGRKYKEVSGRIAHEVKGIIKQLSPTLYKRFETRGPAEMELKKKFFGLFPEIEGLLEGQGTSKEPALHTKSSETEKEESHKNEEFREELRSPYWVEKPPWSVPAGRELCPGLIVILEAQNDHTRYTLEMVSMPRINLDGEFVADIKIDGGSVVTNLLKNIGLVKDSHTDLWYTYYKPVEWYHKNTEKT